MRARKQVSAVFPQSRKWQKNIDDCLISFISVPRTVIYFRFRFQKGERHYHPKEEDSSITQEEEEAKTAPPQKRERKAAPHNKREGKAAPHKRGNCQHTEEGWDSRSSTAQRREGDICTTQGKRGETTTLLYYSLLNATYFNLNHIHLVTRVECILGENREQHHHPKEEERVAPPKRRGGKSSSTE